MTYGKVFARETRLLVVATMNSCFLKYIGSTDHETEVGHEVREPVRKSIELLHAKSVIASANIGIALAHRAMAPEVSLVVSTSLHNKRNSATQSSPRGLRRDHHAPSFC